jgi:hypothetical protein
MTPYTPRPLDTKHIQLPTSLQELLEQLARNTHEVWAAQRIKDGWTYGPKRDDEAKKHPCLIPYEELPESEKEYDRKTAGEALKAIISLGYSIQEPK